MERVRMVLDLLPTMKEGLDYVDSKLRSYDLDGAAPVFRDTLEALEVVERTMRQLAEEKKVKWRKGPNLEKALEQLVTAWEAGDATKTLEFYHSAVKPAFSSWRKRVEKSLLPLTQM